MDWQFVDFDLTKDVLQKPLFIYGVNSPVPREECTTQDNHFTCSKKRLFADTYNNLDIELNKIEVGQGDDIFEFKPAWDEEGLKDYVFRVARQNRPPALDYISRCPAEEYDYLVVKNDPYLGKINFTAFARDPDEDGVELSFAVGGQQISASDSRFDKLPSEVGSGENIVLTVSASDGYLRDWQDVRINVAPRLEPEIRIWNALLGKEHEQAEILSIEDPVCLEINTKNLQTIDGFSLNLQRGSLENLRNGQNGLFSSDGNIFASCELDMFDIESIEEQMKKVFHTGSNALHLQGRVPYGEEEQCGYDVDVTKTMEVKACLPWRGSQDPFIPGSSSGSNFKLNHSCCEGTIDDSSSWKLASEGKICSEREGCFNATEPFYLYQKVRRCGDAQGKVRGNLCGGDEKVIRLQRGRDICGDSALSSCRMLIARECVRNEAWSFISNEGWCHGNSGCNRFCDSEVVDPLGMTKAPGFLLSRDGKHLKCGCRGQLDGSPCDENFDGVFGGQCIGGSCTEA